MGLLDGNSRDAIINEFGTNTKNAHITNGSLADAYDKVFGGTNYSRTAFNGVGKADALIGAAKNVTDTTATIEGTVQPEGLDTTYRFEYGIGNYANTTAWKTVTGGSGDTLVSENISGLNDDSTYQYRLVVYNNFNSESADWVSSSSSFTTQVTASPPGNLTISQATFSAPATVNGSWDNSTTTEAIEVQWYRNGSLHATSSLSAGSTSDSQGGYYNGDSAYFRVRYTTGGNTSWATSGTITINIFN